jgi:hypothetical protein
MARGEIIWNGQNLTTGQRKHDKKEKPPVSIVVPPQAVRLPVPSPSTKQCKKLLKKLT